MGLAASQARFLAITARKADCEFRSMQIAQDKLSVTRKLADVTQQYQNAINQTKFAWDYDLDQVPDYDLSYGLLMQPTTLNNYNPYLITNRTGAVVLNNKLANAATAAISRDGSPAQSSMAGYNKFIDALSRHGVITGSIATSIKAQGSVTDKNVNESQVNYNPKAGYGSTPLSKDPALAKNIIGLTYNASQKEYKLGLDSTIGGSTYSEDRTSNDKFHLSVNGSYVSSGELADLTLGDLLDKNIILTYSGKDGQHGSGLDKSKFMTAVNAIFTKIDTFLTGTTKIKGLLATSDPLVKEALATAKLMVLNSYLSENSIKIINTDKKDSKNASNVAVNNASSSNLIVQGQSKGNKKYDTVAISLSNLLSSYLTYFDMCYTGFESNYYVGTDVSSSYFVTDDPNYNYLMTNNDEASENLIYADFYMQLYNNICHNGWTECDDIEDNTYLQNALKNGTYFITSLNTDGYFYQGRYNEIDCIVEVEDSTAIAEAEAEFNAEKTKLTYREEKLDLEMKNLDTEISSLTTEYDSVKNLISKSVEKVFTMFQ